MDFPYDSLFKSAEQSTEDLLFAIQQQNLIYNYNFLYFSNQAVNSSSVVEYNHPDGWMYKDSSESGTIGFQDDACKITTGTDSNMSFKQMLNEFPRWKSKLQGKLISVEAVVGMQPDQTLSLSVSDGINTSSRTLTPSKESDEVFKLQFAIDPSAEKLEVEFSSDSQNAVFLIKKVFGNIGKIALENLPCVVKGVIGERKQYIATQNPPAEELSLCESAQELSSSYTRLDSVLNGKFGKGSSGNSMLPDVRGYFSRAWNNLSERDPDAKDRETLGNTEVRGDFVGTSENDEFRSHKHDLDFNKDHDLDC